MCFSGQIRTGVESSENIKLFIGNLLPYCDIFIHTWDTDTPRSITPYEVVFDSDVSEYTIRDIKRIYSPKTMIVEDYAIVFEKANKE